MIWDYQCVMNDLGLLICVMNDVRLLICVMNDVGLLICVMNDVRLLICVVNDVGLLICVLQLFVMSFQFFLSLELSLPFVGIFIAVEIPPVNAPTALKPANKGIRNGRNPPLVSLIQYFFNNGFVILILSEPVSFKILTCSLVSKTSILTAPFL